jgi:D-alanyl-D-alanine carboxypeptidase
MDPAQLVALRARKLELATAIASGGDAALTLAHGLPGPTGSGTR